MKLGVFFIGNPQSGGNYQYSLNILDSLKDRHDEVIIFNLSGEHYPQKEYRKYFKSCSVLRMMSSIRRYSTGLGSKFKISRNQPVTNASPVPQTLNRTTVRILKLLLRRNRIDLNIFTAAVSLSFMLDTPFIMPVQDLQHRLNPQFPEVSAHGIEQQREYLYSNAIPRAKAILVDSEIGKEDVLNCYPVADGERIKVLPFTPPNYLRRDYTPEALGGISRKYRLPPRYLFYPANFWAHKNHEAIVRALAYIRENHHQDIPVIFVGSREGKYSQYDKVKELSSILCIEDLVRYLGYVPNEDVGCLYKLAEALVMPTYFGPTNIPYLEAFALGCSVIGSDIRGIREQIGDAGLLANPEAPEDLAVAILKIWNDKKLRKVLIDKGYARVKQWGFEQFAAKLNLIIDEVTKTV